MTILQNLFKFSVPSDDLIVICILYIRSVIENSTMVWHSSLTNCQNLEIDRVQKVALRIILKNDYISYENALKITSLPTLSDRQLHLCKTFAKKCTRNPNQVICSHWILLVTILDTQKSTKWLIQRLTDLQRVQYHLCKNC